MARLSPVLSVYASEVMSPDGGFATTDVNGNYELQVGPGVYRIQFSPGSPYVDEFYNGSATSEQADLVTIGTADVTGIDAETVAWCDDFRSDCR